MINDGGFYLTKSTDHTPIFLKKQQCPASFITTKFSPGLTRNDFKVIDIMLDWKPTYPHSFSYKLLGSDTEYTVNGSCDYTYSDTVFSEISMTDKKISEYVLGRSYKKPKVTVWSGKEIKTQGSPLLKAFYNSDNFASLKKVVQEPGSTYTVILKIVPNDFPPKQTISDDDICCSFFRRLLK